jgi:hypothetical protein
MDYGLEGSDSIPGEGKIFSSTASGSALKSSQPRIQWVSGALSSGVKRPWRETDRSPSSSTEVKTGVTPPLLHTSSWHRENFTILPLYI